MDDTELEITERNYEEYEASDAEDDFPPKERDLSPFGSPSDRKKPDILSALRSIKENQETQNSMLSQMIVLMEGQQKLTNKLLEIEKAKIRAQIAKPASSKIGGEGEASDALNLQTNIISQLNETFKNLKQSLEQNGTSKVNIQRDYKLTEKALNLLDCINPELRSNDVLEEVDENNVAKDDSVSKEFDSKEFKSKNVDDFKKSSKGHFPTKRTQWHVGPPPPSAKRCFRCNKIGHNAPECPLAEYGLWFCYYCQAEKKHKGTDCPRSNAGSSKDMYFKKFHPGPNKYMKREYDGGREKGTLSKTFKRTVKPDTPGRTHNQYYKAKEAKAYASDSEETSWKRQSYNNY